ncbi:hypothetical protein Pmani_004661 [Petrolisthes manimaculis]|nr:hypothetical protein Pmani_033926 [Petrolisthes manimaculis]KAK4324716.1 hypothetical protein Pmani_004661 [Petrolisthes manimaculis]
MEPPLPPLVVAAACSGTAASVPASLDSYTHHQHTTLTLLSLALGSHTDDLTDEDITNGGGDADARPQPHLPTASPTVPRPVSHAHHTPTTHATLTPRKSEEGGGRSHSGKGW